MAAQQGAVAAEDGGRLEEGPGTGDEGLRDQGLRDQGLKTKQWSAIV
jgi:hypothetical protein